MNLDTTPVFTRNYASDKKIKVNRGGTRSSKTRSLAQLSLLWLMTGQISRTRKIPKGVWSTVRKYSTTLDATVIRDFEEEIDKQQIYGLLKHNKTKRTYQYGERMVEFFGADDEKKLRGAARNILYCNEANELAFKKQFFQLMIRTTDDVFIDFNPDDEDVWINTELEQKRARDLDDVDVIVSTYKDNTFLPKSLIKEIEYLEKTDPEFWKIYGLGEYGKVYGVIFENWKVVKSIPENAKQLSYGLDFGFTNDVTAIVDVYLLDGELWVDELIYERGLVNVPIHGVDVQEKNISDRMIENKIKKHIEISADSAEQKSVKELSLVGWNITGVKKPSGSVNHSIDILKRYKINITERSVNIQKELRTYKWKVDKSTGKSINEPVDYNNHAIDALRYVALNKLNSNGTFDYTFRL